MYLVQGVIGKRITGKSWEENVREMIFEPISMTNANFTIDAMKKNKEAALGYRTAR